MKVKCTVCGNIAPLEKVYTGRYALLRDTQIARLAADGHLRLLCLECEKVTRHIVIEV